MSDLATAAATQPMPNAARIRVEDQRIYRITGPGTDKFLQGQFSQQLSDVTEFFSPRAAASTPKGRAYCLTRMVRDGDDILIALPESLADETVNHLRKYLMLFRGTEMRQEDNASLIGLLGETAADALLEQAAERLDSPNASGTVPGGHLVRTVDTAEGLARFEFWQTTELPDGVSEELERLAKENLATWQASEIAAGVASLTPETKESYVPQMLNWQHLDGVHFKKGCYTGQEVIARMHFLGQLKKSLFRFAIPAGVEVPSPGMALKKDGRTVGDVVNAVALSDGTSECLAVVRHDAADQSLTLETAPDQPLAMRPLPYRVPEREPSDT